MYERLQDIFSKELLVKLLEELLQEYVEESFLKKLERALGVILESIH